MTIIIFDNIRGIIYGSDPSKIISRLGGVLQIGSDRIKIKPKVKIDLPNLCAGHTGEVDARFYCDTGCTHELLKVNLNGGVIVPPSAEYEKLARDYKRVLALTDQTKHLTEELERLNALKQEAVNALNENPLKYLIES